MVPTNTLDCRARGRNLDPVHRTRLSTVYDCSEGGGASQSL